MAAQTQVIIMKGQIAFCFLKLGYCTDDQDIYVVICSYFFKSHFAKTCKFLEEFPSILFTSFYFKHVIQR